MMLSEKKMMMIIILGLFFYISAAICPYNNDFTANQKFSLTGTYMLDISSQITSLNETNWFKKPVTIVITYPQQFNNQSLYAAVTLNDYTALDILNGVSAQLKIVSINATQIFTNVSTQNANQISRLVISYLIIVRNQVYNENFMILTFKKTFETPGKAISNTNNSFHQQNIALQYIFNQNNAKILSFISGIHSSPIDNTSLTIDIICKVDFISSKQLSIVISSASDSATLVQGLTYTFIMFNQDGLNLIDSNLFFFEGMTISKNIQLDSSPTIYADFTTLKKNFNTLLGLNSFKISGANSLVFNFSVAEQNSLNIQFGSNFKNIQFSVLLISSKYCSYRAPYQYVDSQKFCFEACPQQTLANNQLECIGKVNVTSTECSQSSTSISSTTLIGIAAGIGGAIATIIIGIVIYKCQPNQKDKQGSNNNGNAQTMKQIIQNSDHVASQKEFDHNQSQRAQRQTIDKVKTVIMQQKMDLNNQKVEKIDLKDQIIEEKMPQLNSKKYSTTISTSSPSTLNLSQSRHFQMSLRQAPSQQSQNNLLSQSKTQISHISHQSSQVLPTINSSPIEKKNSDKKHIVLSGIIEKTVLQEQIQPWQLKIDMSGSISGFNQSEPSQYKPQLQQKEEQEEPAYSSEKERQNSIQ